MSRVKTGTTRRARHNKVLARTSGFRMTKNRLYKVAHEALLHAGKYAYIGRRNRKRDFRALWITRISGALRQLQDSTINYSSFMSMLAKANIQLNRKMLAELAARDFEAFRSVVKAAESSK